MWFFFFFHSTFADFFLMIIAAFGHLRTFLWHRVFNEILRNWHGQPEEATINKPHKSFHVNSALNRSNSITIRWPKFQGGWWSTNRIRDTGLSTARRFIYVLDLFLSQKGKFLSVSIFNLELNCLLFGKTLNPSGCKHISLQLGSGAAAVDFF